MCEPLINKSLIKNKIDVYDIDNSRITEDLFFAKDVKSAVLCYKKYKSNYFKFKVDFPNEAKKLMGIELQGWKIYPTWKDWLFDYCFQDVIQDNK